MAGGKIYQSRYKSNKNQFSKSLAKKVKVLANQIEKKHHDIPGGTATFANDMTARALTLMAQGDTSSTRTGLKIYAKSLRVNGTITWNAAATQESICRLLIVMDKDNNGALPAFTDILEAASVNSQYNNVTEGKRFVVLKDMLFTNNDAHTAIPKERAFTFNIKLNKSIYYLDGTSNASALGRNNIHLIAVGDVTTASGNAISLLYTSRMYYTDL